MNNERMIAVSPDLIERAISLLDLLPESGTIIELRAALATQPAGGEPVAWRYRTHGNGPWYVTTNLIHARVFEGTEDGGQVQGLFAVAPPAAAHGDEAATLVKALSLLWKTTNFLPRGGSLDGRVSAFLAQHAPEPVASAAAMRAQGDGGSGDA
ncbi:hypothetical protein [Pseudomonas sp. Snoq117.2]|jgi:hypothetical protein|uniref:hypothetical protein n=1 Tax=Pseudomonas sp. Snoq117.2 TaxID=1500302 RepID=UPI0008C095B0|nr:hypothetical protein [Pseudomonas sp. Snoq117.2]SEO64706.1 hypothetical protein SAMN02787149_101826 [Pseudomonas sp. Snoq117.2]